MTHNTTKAGAGRHASSTTTKSHCPAGAGLINQGEATKTAHTPPQACATPAHDRAIATTSKAPHAQLAEGYKQVDEPQMHSCPDCGHTWQHGQHGGHSCVKRLRQQLAEKSQEVPVVPFGQGKNVTVNSRYHLPTDDTAASLTISENGKSAVTLTFASQSHASDVLKALVTQRYARPAVPTIHIGSGHESVITLPGSMISPQGEEVTTLTIIQGETTVRLTFPTDRRATEFLRLLINDPSTPPLATAHAAAAPDPDTQVTVSRTALKQVLNALANAPAHHIREMQVTRMPADMFPDNPINILIAEFNGTTDQLGGDL
ncbi:MAG: hypothetical protein V7756_04725 [Halopseudomonas sp.]|uniref:hypothetical protein n=1 Tax=Halopseudomonas sp. TaxID=2901191 RepID=UPI00300270F8